MIRVKIVFTVTQQQQQKIGNRLVEEAKKMKCYKRVIYEKFVSGLCGPQFLSYLPKRFTYLCRALYGDVHIGVPFWCTNMASENRQKKSGVHFFYKNSFFSLEN